MKPKIVVVTGIVIGSLCFGSYTLAKPMPKKLLGEPLSGEVVARTIVINPETKRIQVTSGETVKFVVGSQSFGWRFDGPEGAFELEQIVPKDITVSRKVTGYVNRNPLYALP
jgi:hypothetical protein